ncbi:MAG: hypothetical protein AB1485_04910 [Candidatus Thermoplasmatota archaeon]
MKKELVIIAKALSRVIFTFSFLFLSLKGFFLQEKTTYGFLPLPSFPFLFSFPEGFLFSKDKGEDNLRFSSPFFYYFPSFPFLFSFPEEFLFSFSKRKKKGFFLKEKRKASVIYTATFE